jgi:hypothetical protein
MKDFITHLEQDRNIYLVKLKTYAELVETDPSKITNIAIGPRGVVAFLYTDDRGCNYRVFETEIQMYGKYILCVRSNIPGKYYPVAYDSIWFDSNFIKGEPLLMSKKDLTFA